MTVVQRVCQCSAQGHRRGRCSRCRRPDRDTLAGVLMIRARTVAPSALVNFPPAVTPMARVRLNAIVAAASQAALAWNDFEVIWSHSHGVHDVRDEGVLLSGACRGWDYLPLSITETEGSQCEYSVCLCQVLGSSPGRCSAMIMSR